jgi:hypothetical protein
MAELVTAQDRCDACGAEAKLRATFNSGELLFCGHHGRKYLPQLIAQAIEMYDPNNELDLHEPQLL